MIKEILENYALSTGRVFADRLSTVGASEIGLCARRVHWTKKQHPHDPGYVDSWGARIRGRVMEDEFWYPALKAAYGPKLRYAGPNQKTFVSGVLSATPDGLIEGLPKDALARFGIANMGSTSLVAECKSIDPRVNLTKAKEENAYQVQVQIGIIRESTNFRPNYGLISYTDASFWNEITEFPVKFEQATYDGAKVRAKKILSAETAQELPPEGWIAGGGECEFCPFTRPCGVVRRSVPTTEAAADPQFVAEIVDMCRHVLTIKNKVEEDSATVKALEQEIKDRLRSKNVRRIPGVVVWSAQKGRQSYDNKAIKEAAMQLGLDIEQYSTVGEPTDRMQIQVSLDPSGSGDDAPQQ